MDMDFPDPQELEWLETNNSDLHDDVDFELDYPQPPPSPPSEPEPPPESPEPEPQIPNLEPEILSSKPTLFLPPKPPTIKPQINPKKRFRSDVGPELIDPGNVGPPSAEEKRSRVDNVAGDDDDEDEDEDEDWLRYSPPRPAGNGDADVAMVVEGEQEEERVLSRYATEIDGDCVPITGLDGERVYAKICRVEREERVKKLDIKGDFNGEVYCFHVLSSYFIKKI